MTALLKPRFITVEEYLALEEASPVKHEYCKGNMRVMAGSSPAHAAINFNICGAVGIRLRVHHCRGANSDQRVKVAATELFT